MENFIPKIESNVKETPTITFTSGNNYTNTKIENVDLNNSKFVPNYTVKEMGTINASRLDLSKVSNIDLLAYNGSFMDIKDARDLDFHGDLTYIMREDGIVELIKDNKIIGYTKKEYLSENRDKKEIFINIENKNKNNINNNNNKTTTSTSNDESNKTLNKETNETTTKKELTNEQTSTTQSSENVSKTNDDKKDVTNEYPKSGTLDGSKLDLSKLSGTSYDANNGNFINKDKIYKDSFNKEINYEVREDGSVLLKSGTTALGFTTTAALGAALGSKLKNKNNPSFDENNKQTNYNPLNNDTNKNVNKDNNINIDKKANNMNYASNNSNNNENVMPEPNKSGNNATTITVDLNTVKESGNISSDNINLDYLSLTKEDLANNKYLDAVDKNNINNSLKITNNINYEKLDDGTIVYKKNDKIIGYSNVSLQEKS